MLSSTDSSERQHVLACHLGRVDYPETRALQKALQTRLVEAKRSDPPETVPHVWLLVEHPHVYTLGKSGDAANMLLSDERLDEIGATFHEIERGGDVTYHGPGQLVGYPILDLDRFFTDLGRYLRSLEEVIIQTCADHGIDGGRVEGRTGTWIGPDEHGPERKICAMGVHCSRWVTMHGFAFNVNVDLDYFGHIVPCGIRDRGVTSLAHELNRSVSDGEVLKQVVGHFSTIFDATVELLHGDDARRALDDVLGSSADIPHVAA
ncbi:lipoyl(octanoyl) transferase [Longibacter salinarum]|uniref:Octanoyltransferase n=1 Tax=Longibacter salinarum TaxID=1850348 RepID=A0A2A8CX05_9BACT|nr:lipoyl(octanoyl) transferase LipB [Longibacter salinarum]PEN13232.1 lipoyl(octanoyl) transferase [Longibacter salinarum]